jgi:hypothetical protein
LPITEIVRPVARLSEHAAGGECSIRDGYLRDSGSVLPDISYSLRDIENLPSTDIRVEVKLQLAAERNLVWLSATRQFIEANLRNRFPSTYLLEGCLMVRFATSSLVVDDEPQLTRFIRDLTEVFDCRPSQVEVSTRKISDLLTTSKEIEQK